MTPYLQALLVLSGLGGTLAGLLLLAGRWLANYGVCSITINAREPFEIEGGGKLLEALYDRGIFIPSACGGQGTCGYCKVRVLAGGGPVLPTELPYLRADELADGTRLACQVKVKQNLALAVREEYLSIREFRARVTGARMVTHDTRELSFALIEPAEMEFRPGQYVQVQIPSPGEKIYRAYSICSPPSARREIELLVRLIPGGKGSGYLHAIAVGDEVRFTGAYGDFTLDQDEDVEIVCVGGGCGMAPMRSIVRHLAQTQPGRSCRLFFGARTADDIMYHDAFREISRTMPNFRMHFAISNGGSAPQWEGERGLIHESVGAHLPAGLRTQAFLCGPPIMIDAVTRVLIEKGIPREWIFYDEF